MRSHLTQCLLVSLLSLALTVELPAQTTVFTYQGQLADNVSPATGLYDLRFELFDAATNGTSLGVVTNAAMDVNEGLFAVALDFGAAVFDGNGRWLEIGATTNGGGAFTILSPRQPITPTPYALYAPDAGMANSAATVTGSVDASQLSGTISPNNIGDGTIVMDMLAAGAVGSEQLAANAVTTDALTDGAVTAIKVATVPYWSQDHSVQVITNPTPAIQDYFGWSVAAVGSDRLLVGAYRDDTGASDAGAAYLFATDGTLVSTFENPFPTSSDRFGRSLAAVGVDRVLIGADRDDTGAGDSGAAYLFRTDGTLLTTFSNPTPGSQDYFGSSVAAVGGDRVLIGAEADNVFGVTSAGAAYLFNTNGTLLTSFPNPAPSPGDSFGTAVASVGSNLVLIGADREDTGAPDAGSAYLFSINGTLLNTFTNPSPANNEFFGASVAAVGNDRVLIGAGNPSAREVYMFGTNGMLLTTFTEPNPVAGWFGSSVASIGTNEVLIGAAYDDAVTNESGVAYLFSTDGTLLTTFANPTPEASDFFGISVASAGSGRVLIGAYGDDTGASYSGAAYLFTVESYAPGLVADTVRAGSITTDRLADGAVDSSKLASNAVGSAQIAAGAVGSTQIADGSVSGLAVEDGTLTAVDVAANEFWTATGNSGTTPGSNYLGTADDQSFELKVNSERALRVEPTVDTPNLIGGNSGNSMGSETEGATIGGGGSATSPNTIGANSDYSTIGGGRQHNIADGTTLATIAGGSDNSIGNDSQQSTISGGHNNDIADASWRATVAGGYNNDIGSNSDYSVIGGGFNNAVADNSWRATIAGGHANKTGTNTDYSTVGGGYSNEIQTDASSATIAGGYGNDIGNNADYSVVSGGYGNHIAENVLYGAIPGGQSNEVAASYAFAAGRRAKADHAGAFIWADSTAADFASTAGNQFLVRASGGVGIGTNDPQSALHVAGTVTALGFSGDGAGLTSLSGAALAAGSVSNLALADGVVTTEKIALGAVTTDALADGAVTAADVASNEFWTTTGNDGTTPGTHFLGTTDNQPLDLTVNSQRALRLEYANDGVSESVNLIGGYSGNSVGTGTVGAAIGGGGESGSLNTIGSASDFSTISGGKRHTIADNTWRATIAGGYNNSIGSSSHQVAIGGGYNNNVAADANAATVAGGYDNDIGTNSDYSVISGGYNNTIAEDASWSIIPGGRSNEVGAAASHALAAGRGAKANHAGAFVWADSTDAAFSSTANDQFLVRAAGGVGLGTNDPQSALHVAGTVTATSFAGDGAGLTGLGNPEGFYRPARVYTAVIGMDNPVSAPTGFEEVVTGGSGVPQMLLTADNLVMGPVDSASFGGTFNQAVLDVPQYLFTKDYPTYGHAHVVILCFNADNPALAPAGYTYIAGEDLKGVSARPYLMTGPGGFYLGQLSAWSGGGVNAGPGLLRLDLGTSVGGIAFRVFGVEEDPTTSAGIFPFFIGGSMDLTNDLGTTWSELPRADLASGSDLYVSWTDSATFVGVRTAAMFAGGNYGDVTIQTSGIHKLFLRILSGEGQLSPQVRFQGDVTPPTGWLTLDAADVKGSNGWGYYQATGHGAYLGGLFGWSRKDDLNGFVNLTFSTSPTKVAVQVAP